MMYNLRASWNRLFARPLPDEVMHTLLTRVPYYQALDARHRKRFETRLNALMRELRWVPEDIPEVTPEMKALIGSGIIQLTLGLPYFILTDLNRIHIVPRLYSYRGSEQLMMGDMDLKKKRVSLSWPDAVRGFDVGDDARNIVLHEFTHCIDYEDSRRRFQRFFNPHHKLAWQQEATEEMQHIKNTDDHVIRKYGATNIREMFSVCAEHFFERPEEFQAILPDLYRHTVTLFNQDPIRKDAPILTPKL